jgi:O-antigen ligase
MPLPPDEMSVQAVVAARHVRTPWQLPVMIVASALLLSLPFRATVGWRGGILALLVLILVMGHVWQHGWRANWRTFLPRDRWLRLAGCTWLLLTAGWALAGPNPAGSLPAVRSDVLAPLLAFCAFHAITRDRRDLMRWAMVLFAAQLLITLLAVRDPFQPNNLLHRPAYIDVGVLSVWLVIVASLLPVLWLVPRSMRRWARPMAGLMASTIIVAAFCSGNRVIWTCFAAMVLTGFAILYRRRRHATNTRRGWLMLAGSISALAILGWSSVQLRGPSIEPRSLGSAAYMLQDPRNVLWEEAVRMIGEKPLSGYGFDLPRWHAEFAKRTGAATAPSSFDHAHNALLNYALQMGITGALLVATLFAALFAAFLRQPRALPIERLAATCGVVLVTGFFLRNLTDDFFMRQSLLLFAAVAGMLAGAGRRVAVGPVRPIGSN